MKSIVVKTKPVTLVNNKQGSDLKDTAVAEARTLYLKTECIRQYIILVLGTRKEVTSKL